MIWREIAKQIWESQNEKKIINSVEFRTDLKKLGGGREKDYTRLKDKSLSTMQMYTDHHWTGCVTNDLWETTIYSEHCLCH